MPADTAALLRAHPLFARCSRLDHARLLAAATACQFKAGERLFEAGAPSEHYYWITAGTAKLSSTRSQTAGPGDGLGAEAFADGTASDNRYLASATALTDVSALRLERGALRTLLASRPQLKSAALAELARSLGELAPPAPAAPTAGAGGALADAPLPWKALLGWLATMLLSPLAWWMGQRAGLTPQAAVYLGLFTMAALMWLFALVDEYIPPLIAVVAMLFIELVPARVALHGFYSRTFILLLGVYAVSAVVVASGLAYRLMLWTLLRLPDTPFWHRSALTFFGMVLSIVMPSSNARLALMLPLYKEMDASLGARNHSPEASALVVATFTGATLFSPLLLTAKSSNLAAFAMLPAQVRLNFQGITWLLGAAVVALGFMLVHFFVMRRAWQPGQRTALPLARIRTQLATLGPLQPAEWAAALAFTTFVLGAALPQWHQSQAAWLAGLVLVALMVLGLLDKSGFQSKIDWPTIFFLLCLDGFTDAIGYLQLDKAMLQVLMPLLGWIHGDLVWFTLLALFVTVALRLALPTTAGMVLAATLLLPIGLANGIHPWIVVFLTSLFSDIWFMPHQQSSFAQLQGAGMRQRCDEGLFFRYAWWLNGVRVLLAFASIPWWRWLGLDG
ncbi:SLC13 family permease [Comamonas flocculans]|uniref:Cyclic nucleotide-binding domain-containing protein n=1 Tax=Comamonas flocculans TaxID=2597701 RepID=A0A5B8RRY1_9BURK|nr:SLC13 family permease [Comamonas flocculans]QEA12409.1 cyclic nucleotide-binding domain-containing protein [Comamonas flocculans]